ncbi:uncharacterized protein N7484_011539 [Penicillium longicatenatum]|uniref:uncharacterized protein n=1 Tax=Penicillium longicatenatum TaxID=1561947 RepID=UPI002549004F|nr:uncharacterized protein N7484_011539 [Penicillium longicatenatum]KAJ5631439.1 hypothetical protein N7484_011539 [Penicillium longicatenatum]
MDLRTIMNTDAGGASKAKALPPNQSSSPASDPSQKQRAQSAYSEYPARPPQPPLQHPPHASPEQSSPYGPTQSPYQQFNAGPPPINTAVQSQRTQSPTHVSTPYGSGAPDPYGAAAYNSHPQHPAGPLASPYTPQPMSAGVQHTEPASYFAQQRSHSLHSVMANPRPITRDSPPSVPQPHPSHQFSPSAHQSVPGTPLGPPPAFISRQSPSARPKSSGRDSPRNPLSSPRAAHDRQARDPTQVPSPSRQRQFSPHSRPIDHAPPFPSTGGKQESSEIASPEFSRQNSTAANSDSAGAGPRRPSEDKWNDSPTAPFHSGPGPDSRASPVATNHTQINSSPSASRSGSHFKMEIDHEPSQRISSQPPKRKRRRYNEPPIYAQRSARTKGRPPMIPNPQPPIPKHARQLHEERQLSRRASSATGPAVAAVTPTSVRTPVAVSQSANGPPTPAAAPAPTPTPAPVSSTNASTKPVGILGPWEPSITGFIPHEEVTKLLCDFLFQHVVMRNDVGAGPAGSAAAGQGAIIEIEAKLGHVMDMDRGERLNLPILTETVVNRDIPRFRTSFESSMTVEQHRAMNNFLNEAVKASMPGNNPNRVPISYAHKKERDTFYEVSPADLPPVIRQNLNPRHKPKVRVTTDQRTGEVLAKIVKCRVADIDVCSPRTTVDWRVSVNLEMEYEGDHRNLPLVDMSKGGRGERNKDRMSYRHLAYQVDLTQVAKAEPPTKNEFEHELEVEVSAAEIRRQGQLAMNGDPSNQYEELVKGFVDNIRVLARAVPP